MVRLENLSVAGVRSPRRSVKVSNTVCWGKGVAQMMAERCTAVSLMAALSLALALLIK